MIKMLCGKKRQASQRLEVLKFVETYKKETVGSKKDGALLLPKKAWKARMHYKEGESKKKSKLLWKKAFANPMWRRITESGAVKLLFQKHTETVDCDR